MKKYVSILFASLFLLIYSASILDAQIIIVDPPSDPLVPPQAMTYQAEARDSKGNVIHNQTLSILFVIKASETTTISEWKKEYKVTTDKYGLFSVVLGDPEGNDEAFNKIPWSKSPMWLEVFLTYKGETSDMGPFQFLTVPYAMHAKTATSAQYASVASSVKSVDWTNINKIPPGFNDNVDNVDDGDNNDENEIQKLTLTGNTVSLDKEGGSFDLPVVGPAGAIANDLISYDGVNWVAKSAVIQNTGSGESESNMQPFTVINHIIALQGVFPSRNQSDPFIAEIIMFGGNFAPRGWALCDGQLLPISQNQALFSLLGTMYGGDGRTTFAVPDLRGRTAIHPGNGPGLSSRSIGDRGGSESLTIDVMPSHTHAITYE